MFWVTILYDELFSIDTQSGDFLGEYGVGVSEIIGVGDPKKVTALEIWLFDKNDIKTATKVLMSAHAFSDGTIRARLEPKGELVLVEPQKQVMLETATLQLLAKLLICNTEPVRYLPIVSLNALHWNWQFGKRPVNLLRIKKSVIAMTDFFVSLRYSIFKIFSLIFPAGVSTSTISSTL